MYKNKKRDRVENNQISPSHKMTRNSQQFGTQPSNNDLMLQLEKMMESRSSMIEKIDNLEKRFTLVEKLFGEVETLKNEVDRLSKQNKPNEAFMRFEVEQKKKAVLEKGLQMISNKKYEPRNETYDRITELFGLTLTVEDYQRLGPLKSDDPSNTLVRIQFWSKDDKAQIYAKFKEFSDDPVIKKISLINGYPLFQLPEVKRLSNEAYSLRQKDKAIRKMIVPRGLEVHLQTRKGFGKWAFRKHRNLNVIFLIIVILEFGKWAFRKHRNLNIIFLIIVILEFSRVKSFDSEIEEMRSEEMEKHDISIFVEIKVEYIHSRITLVPLIAGLEQASKLSTLFGNRMNSTFSSILNSRIKKMVKKIDRKFQMLYGCLNTIEIKEP